MISDRWRTAGVMGVVGVFVWVLAQVSIGPDPSLETVDPTLPPARFVVLPPQVDPVDATVAVSSTVRGGAVGEAASATAAAERGAAVQVAQPPAAPSTAPGGVHGLPFAPAGLTGCDEARFYRVQFGLPDRFDGLAWRESNCRNDVSSFCCHGLYQLYVTLHLADHRLAPLYAECGIDEVADVLGLDPLDKQRNVCAAAAVYAISGGGAWDAW